MGGGMAYNYHEEPMYTFDMDVYIYVKDDAELIRVYDYLIKEKDFKWDKEHIIINKIPVNIFPANINSLFENASRCAKLVHVYNQPIKIFTIEYLIATFLYVFREKDKIRVKALIKHIDLNCLKELLKNYENEKRPLQRRLQQILETI
jgi:hypothetical protein